MRVEILTIGDELLLGFTIDSNSAVLGLELAELGVEVVRRAAVPDDRDVIVSAVKEALDRTGAVITTGGLGPTDDDLTCEAVAASFGVPLVADENVLASLVERWRQRGFGDPPDSFLRQALVPHGATVLRNPVGTAPGIWIEREDGGWVVILPGVPREMEAILREELRPRLARRLGNEAHVVRSRTLRTVGIPESLVAEQLSNVRDHLGELSLAYLPTVTGVDLRLTARGVPSEVADRRLAAGIGQLRERLGKWAYGEGTDDLAAVVLDACRRSSLTLAVAESCTGGMLGARLTAIPGSSEVLTGGVVAYANEVKTGVLGVSSSSIEGKGAVSEEVALEMAMGVRELLDTGMGVAITGVAGPGGGSRDKPVGTVWLAVDTPHFRKAERHNFRGSREEIRVRAAQAALALTWRSLTT